MTVKWHDDNNTYLPGLLVVGGFFFFQYKMTHSKVILEIIKHQRITTPQLLFLQRKMETPCAFVYVPCSQIPLPGESSRHALCQATAPQI